MSTQAAYQAEQLEKCKTDAQLLEANRLIGLGKAVYVMSRQGKGVVAEFRRYVEKRDPEQIGDGLYHLMIQGAGGFNDIAHFNLHGFRSVYPHPAMMIEQLILPEIRRWPDRFEDADHGHSFYVYTDGMNAGQVAIAIVKIATDNWDGLIDDYNGIVRSHDEAELRRLADKLGVTISTRGSA